MLLSRYKIHTTIAVAGTKLQQIKFLHLLVGPKMRILLISLCVSPILLFLLLHSPAVDFVLVGKQTLCAFTIKNHEIIHQECIKQNLKMLKRI